MKENKGEEKEKEEEEEELIVLKRMKYPGKMTRNGPDLEGQSDRTHRTAKTDVLPVVRSKPTQQANDGSLGILSSLNTFRTLSTFSNVKVGLHR